MSNNILVDYSMDFSVFIVNICDAIKGKICAYKSTFAQRNKYWRKYT